MGNLTIAAIFILMSNLLLVFATIGMQQIYAANPDPYFTSQGSTCYKVSNTILGSRQNSTLPTGAASGVVVSSGNFVTDLFNKIGDWLSAAGSFVWDILTAPSTMIDCTSLPTEFATPLKWCWYLLSLLVLSAWMFWRD